MGPSMGQYEDDFDRDARLILTVFFYIVVVCVGVILIGLCVTVPWLGIPLTIIVVMGYTFIDMTFR